MEKQASKDIQVLHESNEQDYHKDISFYLPEKAQNTRILKCLIVGGGIRGQCYSKYAKDFPHLLKIVAICDPRLHIRRFFEREYGIPAEFQFTDWTDLTKVDRIADFVCICTPDRLHKDPAIAFAKMGYHIILEKPMATTRADCVAIKETCEMSAVMLAVCHVLRYYPPNKKLKELIDSGVIGDVVNIQHTEPVGFWHFAHSYVRGNWHKESDSSFSLLAKCCHDVDLISYWMKGQLNAEKLPTKCTSLSSFGSLFHFRQENKPVGAAGRCLDCAVEKQCPYSAKKIYLEPARGGYWGFPVNVVADVEDIEALTDKLQMGPYGKCVYDCDNDVCDNQVVNFQYSGGQTASLTMVAFTESVCKRVTKAYGTKGELTFDESKGGFVTHHDFLTRKSLRHDCTVGLPGLTSMTGHGGADFHLIDDFVKAILYDDPTYVVTGPEDTLRSHLLCFAAEESRLEGKTVYVKDDYTR